MNPRDIENPVALVVNSHHAVRRALCERIRSSFANFRLREAASVQDALCILEAEHVDIVVLDGEASGIDALRGTRAILERSPKASVVLMSAVTEPACRSAASRAGAMAFVSKRAVGTELMKVLETITRPSDDGSSGPRR
ncbi:MAG TPA: response regulator [Burkholderiales bacterium]|nr:response regulator [Burkholderiales bacterium]